MKKIVISLFAVTFILGVNSAQADIANRCDWDRGCVESEILDEVQDLYSRLVWTATLGLDIDPLVDHALAEAPQTSTLPTSMIVRFLLEQGRVEDALRLSIRNRHPHRSKPGFVYPGLFQGEKTIDISGFPLMFRALVLASSKADFSYDDLKNAPKDEITNLLDALYQSGTGTERDSQRNLRRVSQYGLWGDFAQYIVPHEPSLVTSAIWHAVEFGDYTRAIFLANVERYLTATGTFSNDEGSRLSTPLQNAFRNGAVPACYSEQEIKAFLELAQWPDMTSSQPICYAFFQPFPPFNGTGYFELYIEKLPAGAERKAALDAFRDLVLQLPRGIESASIVVDRLLQVEGGEATRTQELIAHFFGGTFEEQYKKLSITAKLKSIAAIDTIQSWIVTPPAGANNNLINRLGYYSHYPTRNPYGVTQEAAFAFYDKTLSTYPLDDHRKIEFFFTLFSRRVDWAAPGTNALVKDLSDRFEMDWREILEEKPTSVLFAAMNPKNPAALRFILDTALLDEQGQYRPLKKLDEGYAYYLMEAMWTAGFCEDFHQNAKDPRVIDALRSSKRGFEYFNLHRLYVNNSEGCWK